MNDFANVRMTSPPPVRDGIDRAKLARLRTDLDEAREMPRGLNSRAHAERDHIAHLVLTFPASHAARVHYRPGDETSVFLKMTGDQAEQFAAEIRAAREIADRKAALATLMQRISVLNERAARLNQLVVRCEAYAREV